MKKILVLLVALFVSTAGFSQKASATKTTVGIADYIGKKEIPVSALGSIDSLAMEVNDKRVEGKILGFTLMIKGDMYYVESAVGPALNDFMKEQIAAMKPGMVLQFKDVKVSGEKKGFSFSYKVVK